MNTTPNKEVPTTVVTPRARMSFPELLEPKADLSGRMAFSVSLLIPVASDISHLRAAAEAVALKKWPKKELWDVLKIHMPFSDGNSKGKIDSNGNFKVYKGHENTIVVNCKRQLKSGPPTVVGANPKLQIKDAAEIYGGRWCRAQLNAFAYDIAGNKGVAFGLNSIQLLEHDEPFASGASDPAAIFGNEEATTDNANNAFMD